MDRAEAIKLLRKYKVPENVIEHCKKVSENAVQLAERIPGANVEKVEIGALLHDIGRCKSHGTDHGILGGKILRNEGLEEYAPFAENHLGAGITRFEAKSIGLPHKDYLPRTVEERIVAHADNITWGTKTVTVEERIKAWGNVVPPDVIKRVIKLSNEIRRFSTS